MNFSELGLTKRIVADLESLGFVEPTEIQEKTIPAILAGRDIMASAETGSGKTAAYALPVIQALRGGSERKPRVLVLVPTRELALQVESQFERFGNNCGMRTVTIYGGVGMEKQTRLLRRGVDVIVATPGRLYDHMERGNAELGNIQMLVLDEADRMLDMGFTPQVRKIVAGVPSKRQTIMFSATISKSVEQSAEEFLKNPVNVFVNTQQVEPTSIEQRIYHVSEDGKDDLLIKLIKEHPDMSTVLVFTKTRRKAAKIRKSLGAAAVTADEIHGDISQAKREKTLTRYRDGEFSVLVATDIAARGLDIPAISHVVNYDLPMSAADYVHRIGRTGRAGRAGIALSFVSADQRYLMREIEKITGRPLDPNGPALPQESHRRGGSARPGRSNRNSAGSGHRRRPEDPTQFGGGVFSKKRESSESGSGSGGQRRDGSNSRGRDESQGRPARTASGHPYRSNREGAFNSDTAGGSRARQGEFRPRHEGTDKFAGSREGTGEFRPRQERSDKFAGNGAARTEFRPKREGPNKFEGNRTGTGESRPRQERSDKPAGNGAARTEFRPKREGNFDGNRAGNGDARQQWQRSEKYIGNRETSGEYRPRPERSGKFAGNREAPRQDARPGMNFRTAVARPNRSGTTSATASSEPKHTGAPQRSRFKSRKHD